MTVATGVGSMPGEDFGESLRVVLGETPDLPSLPELPDRGAHATMTGRALALLDGLGADLQPAGWRLTGSTAASGGDHRRARSLLAQDLDTLEEQLQGYAGPLKVAVAGPWTLAATVEKPKGDRVLSDVGARRELAESLASGLVDHVADLRRRLPEATVVVQVDEPALPAVLAGSVPTASGFHRHRSVAPPLASAGLETVFAALRSAGVEPLAHCCAPDAPVALLTGAGAAGVSVDLSLIGPSGADHVAALLEAGAPVHLGVVPTLRPSSAPAVAALSERVLRFLDMLGLDPDGVGSSLAVTPTCGLAGADAGWAREALGLARRTAAEL